MSGIHFVPSLWGTADSYLNTSRSGLLIWWVDILKTLPKVDRW